MYQHNITRYHHSGMCMQHICCIQFVSLCIYKGLTKSHALPISRTSLMIFTKYLITFYLQYLFGIKLTLRKKTHDPPHSNMFSFIFFLNKTPQHKCMYPIDVRLNLAGSNLSNQVSCCKYIYLHQPDKFKIYNKTQVYR